MGLKSIKKLKRKTNKIVKDMNKSLQKDVFGNRFSFHIVERYIRCYEDNSGCYATIVVYFNDSEMPERNCNYYYDNYELERPMLCGGRSFAKDVNNFIIVSDFWKKIDKK